MTRHSCSVLAGGDFAREDYLSALKIPLAKRTEQTLYPIDFSRRRYFFKILQTQMSSLEGKVDSSVARRGALTRFLQESLSWEITYQHESFRPAKRIQQSLCSILLRKQSLRILDALIDVVIPTFIRSTFAAHRKNCCTYLRTAHICTSPGK